MRVVLCCCVLLCVVGCPHNNTTRAFPRIEYSPDLAKRGIVFDVWKTDDGVNCESVVANNGTKKVRVSGMTYDQFNASGVKIHSTYPLSVEIKPGEKGVASMRLYPETVRVYFNIH